MQAPQDRLNSRECPSSLARRVVRLAECYTATLAMLLERDYRLLCPTRLAHYGEGRGVKVNVYAMVKSAYEQVKQVIMSHEPMVIGVQVAVMLGKLLVPTLGLLSIMRRHGITPRSHYVIVTGKAAVLFTYGRDVFGGSIETLRRRRDCKETPLIVATSQGDLLGFGKLVRRNGRLLIRNLLDVGWYLRSGV